MVVKRVKDLDIQNRGFVTAIIGNTDDVFIDNDLCRYSFEEQLYLYLKDEGYKRIYFYNRTYNFHTFDNKEILEQLFRINPARNNADRRPGGRRLIRSNNSDEEANTRIKEKKTSNGRNFFYCNFKDTVLCNTILEILSNTEEPSIIYFPSTDAITMQEDQGLITGIDTLMGEAATAESSNKILIHYSSQSQTAFESYLEHLTLDSVFNKRFFVNLFIANSDIKKENVFFVGLPDKAECRNWLNHLRLCKNQFDYKDFDDYEQLVSYTAQKRMPISTLQKSKYIQIAIDKQQLKSSRKTLDNLLGIDSIRKQFYNFITTIQKDKKRGAPNKMRKHMVFRGNPGTGKTTVARLFARILQEEEILPLGHCIEANVGDLVGQFVGETRLKTKALCEKAKGGILFIDEAYGLYNPNSQSNYETEAVEILIQFMENCKDDSIVIFAGYTNPINEFLNKSNPGFKRRINPYIGYYDFNDYNPTVLLEIFKQQAKEENLDISQEAIESIQLIIEKKYSQRDANWGNAGEVENLLQAIKVQFLQSGDNVITNKHIPQEFLAFIKTDPQTAWNNLNRLSGIDEIRESFRRNITALKRIKEQGINIRIRPHMVFRGNPGTGKTTVAKLFAEILKEEGVLENGKLFEVNVGNLIAGFVGQTRIKTKEVCDNAKGGILFIDEAYGLYNPNTQNDFGKEAVEILIQFMENEKHSLVIIAGYTDQINELIEKGNPGFISRFNKDYFFDFADYDPTILLNIFKQKINDLNIKITSEATNLVEQILNQRFIARDNNWGNAREVENLIQQIFTNYSNTTDSIIDVQHVSPILFGIQQPQFTQPQPQAHSVIKISTTPFFINGYNYDDYRKAMGLLVLDGGDGFGSGFLISSDGYIMTCEHCTTAEKITFVKDDDKSEYEATVIYKNADFDIAILKIEAQNMPFLTITDSNRPLKVGTEVVILGYPSGTDINVNVSAFEGKIANIDKVRNAYQTDAIATHGSSGGAFISKKDGIVYGVLRAGYKDAGINIATDIRNLLQKADTDISIEYI